MFEQLLFLCLLLQTVTLVRLLRRGGQRGYALLITGLFVAGLAGLGRSDRFLGALSVCMTILTVVAPWLLDAFSRWAHGRGRLVWAVRALGVKSVLMPGAGLSRQQQILRGVVLLERRGVDAALEYLRGLADAAEDEGELALIHEQMVSMLFYGMRWDEGIAQYERRFHPGYAALRPMLALGLLRAYGESGRLDRAAGLLRALEDGPVGADPRSAEILGQARFTFLAYAGQSGIVDQVVAQDRCGDLGLTPAVGALFHGISLARSGDPGRAEAALRRVEVVAGPRDRRIIEASRQTLHHLPETELELEPEITRYVNTVADKLVRFLQAAAPLRHRGRAMVTYSVMIVMAAVFGVVSMRGHGGLGLVEMGALTPALADGAWARVFTSVWLHSSFASLLFDVYAMWLAGHLVERLYGGARMGLIVLGSAIAGQAVALLVDDSGFVLGGGGHLLGCGALTAGLWSLLPSRMPELAPRARRSLLLTFLLLSTANLLAIVPGTWGFDTSPIGYGVTVLVASLLASGPRVGGAKVLSRFCAVVLVGLLALTAYAALLVARDDVPTALAESRTQTCDLGGATVATPPHFRVSDQSMDRPGWFMLGGVVDALELRTGGIVEYALLPAVSDEAPAIESGADSSIDASQRPLLFAAKPDLQHVFSARPESTPEVFTAMAATNGEQWDSWLLRDGSESTTQLIERRIAGPDAGAGAGPQAEHERVLVLFASPPELLERQPQLYASILAQARLDGVAASASDDRVTSATCESTR